MNQYNNNCMKAYDLIQVLWVEDDPKVTETYPLKAEILGLELIPFPCWDDAKVALENEYDIERDTLTSDVNNYILLFEKEGLLIE